ncbi:MAG: hypothetical protein LC645_06790 [Geobacteraceae bacterium]|nr:hypothetical protein [Geobacteraceae bacterium]
MPRTFVYYTSSCHRTWLAAFMGRRVFTRLLFHAVENRAYVSVVQREILAYFNVSREEILLSIPLRALT